MKISQNEKKSFTWKIYYLCELYHSYLTTDDETIKETMLEKFLQEKETLVNYIQNKK